jgi:anti-sigma B factor antagonist
MPEIVTRQVDGITVLDIPHSLLNMPRDSKDRGTLNRVVTELLDGGRNKIVLNLSQVVGYCTSTGLSELIWGLKTMRARSGQLKLSNVPPSVRAGLEFTRALKLFDLHDDEAAAIQSFQSAPSETISQLAMREVSGITVLDIPKSIMEISRTSEECGKLLKLVHESLDRGRKNVVLNLSQVGYSSHTALGELVAAFTTIRNQGGHLKLSNVPPTFRAGLEITHLLPIFDIYDDEAAAIHSFQSTV